MCPGRRYSAAHCTVHLLTLGGPMKHIQQLIDMTAVIEETVAHETDITLVFAALHVAAGKARAELKRTEELLIEKQQIIEALLRSEKGAAL